MTEISGPVMILLILYIGFAVYIGTTIAKRHGPLDVFIAAIFWPIWLPLALVLRKLKIIPIAEPENKPCYFCKKTDLPTFLTGWPPFSAGELIWMCRRHLSPDVWMIDAQTGRAIMMYGPDKIPEFS